MKKQIKRSITVLLALCMIFSIGIVGFAAEPQAEAAGISKADFYALLNGVARYEVIAAGEDAGEMITNGEAAAAIGQYWMLKHDYSETAAAAFDDVAADSEYASEIGALVAFQVVPEGGNFEPEALVSPELAAAMVVGASLADFTVTVGTDLFTRDSMGLTLCSASVATEDDILVNRNIIELMGGSEVSEDFRTVEASEGQIVVHLSQQQLALDVVDDMVSLKALAEGFGAMLTFIEDETGIIGADLKLDRFFCKSNRELLDEELGLGYAKYYLRYLETPLPERPDEIAWAAKKDKYALSAQLENDTVLNPETYYKLLDPDYVPVEGWSESSDGKFKTMCTIVDIPFTEETQFVNADALSWFFAWHTLDDLRYMMWNPSCHYGVFVTTGDYDTRTPEAIEAQPMRLFDNNITNWYQRAFGSINVAIEDVSLTNYDGTDAYLPLDGTNSIEKGSGIPINFVDLTDPTLTNRDGNPTPYFSSTEEFNGTGHSIADEFLIQAGVTGEESVMAGVGVPMASMLHILRKIDGEWKIITFFNVMIFPADSQYVNEHQVREMSILAEFLPELYLNEVGKDLKEFADPNCFINPADSSGSSGDSAGE